MSRACLKHQSLLRVQNQGFSWRDAMNIGIKILHALNVSESSIGNTQISSKQVDSQQMCK